MRTVTRSGRSPPKHHHPWDKQARRRSRARAGRGAVQGDAAKRPPSSRRPRRPACGVCCARPARDGDDAVRLEAVRAAGARGGPRNRARRRRRPLEHVRAEATRILAAPGRRRARGAPTSESMLRGGDQCRARSGRSTGWATCRARAKRALRLLGEALGRPQRGAAVGGGAGAGPTGGSRPRRGAAPGTRGARSRLRRAQRRAPGAGAGLVAPATSPTSSVVCWSTSEARARALGRAPGAGRQRREQRRAPKPPPRSADVRPRRRAGTRRRLSPALARLAAQIGRSFLDSPPARNAPLHRTPVRGLTARGRCYPQSVLALATGSLVGRWNGHGESHAEHQARKQLR